MTRKYQRVGDRIASADITRAHHGHGDEIPGRDVTYHLI